MTPADFYPDANDFVHPRPGDDEGWQKPGYGHDRTTGAPAVTGAELIAAERKRQIEAEGWTPEHDDDHDGGELALAACCYATPIPLYRKSDRPLAHNIIQFYDPWPWDDGWDKRKRGGNVPRIPDSNAERVRMLVKAGALVAAEIDRLQRA